MKLFDHSRCEAEIAFLREQVRNLGERNDRLTEALAQRSGIDLVLPRPTVNEEAPIGGMGAEGVNTWFKQMNSGSAIASPVKARVPKEEQKQ